MRSLDLDIESYAKTMTEALAVMFWSAGIDADDLEFVLAPPRKEYPQESSFQSDFLGTHRLWILDFDCCRTISMDEAGVEQAYKAFFKNDPYYPRPGSGEKAEKKVWVVFKMAFLDCSRRIMDEGRDKWYLAEMLMAKIEEEGEVRRIRRETESHVLVE
jgi:hypothetical protein